MNSSTTRYSLLTYLMKLGVEAKHPYSTSACYKAQLEACSFSQVKDLTILKHCYSFFIGHYSNSLCL